MFVKGQYGRDELQSTPRSSRSDPVALSPIHARRRFRVGIVLMVVLASLALLWSHSSWVPTDGDDFYYAASTLQRAGVPYDLALQRSGAYFHDTAPFTLDYGMLSPTLAPMIYPRVVLTTVGQPFVAAAGIAGLYVPGIGFGALTVLLMTLLAKRRIGGVGAILMPMFLVGSTVALDFVFGMYTEAPVITCVAAMLWLLPLGGATRRGWPAAVAAAGLVPLMLLSRQIPVLPVAMVAGGWLWASVGQRRLRNPWLPFMLMITSTTAACYLALNVWAPYNPLPFMRIATHSSSFLETFTKMPSLFVTAMRTDIVHALERDPLGVALVLLALGGLVILRRNPLVGVAIGAELAGLLTVYLNGNSTFWRYESPALPAIALLGTVAVQTLWCRWRGEPLRLPISSVESSSAAPAAARKYLPAIATWAVTAGLIGLTVGSFQPAPIDPAKSLAVSSATFNHWPFTVPSGRLVCGGDDYQVWFDGSDGRRYALSGTAMAHSFLAPRATSIRAGSATYVWPKALTLMDQGMQLCQAGRHYMHPPVTPR